MPVDMQCVQPSLYELSSRAIGKHPFCFLRLYLCHFHLHGLTMITPLKALLYVLVILVGGYSYLRIAAFVHLFADHAGHPLTQAEVAHNYDDQASGLNQPTVPRILHQIFHNWTEPSSETLPSDWNETRQTCIDLNHGWEHWVCTLV